MKRILMLTAALVLVAALPAAACGKGGKKACGASCGAKMKGAKAFAVKGMDDDATAAKVQKIVSGVSGVEKAKACSKCGNVYFTGEKADAAKVKAALAKAGYKTAPAAKMGCKKKAMMKKGMHGEKQMCRHSLKGAEVVKVSGMMCSACEKKVAKAAKIGRAHV